jgi:hypothetical protein
MHSDAEKDDADPNTEILASKSKKESKAEKETAGLADGNNKKDADDANKEEVEADPNTDTILASKSKWARRKDKKTAGLAVGKKKKDEEVNEEAEEADPNTDTIFATKSKKETGGLALAPAIEPHRPDHQEFEEEKTEITNQPWIGLLMKIQPIWQSIPTQLYCCKGTLQRIFILPRRETCGRIKVGGFLRLQYAHGMESIAPTKTF